MKILSLDPGETTGWAYLNSDLEDHRKLADLGQLAGREKLVHFLEDFTRPVDLVIIEAYEINPRNVKMNMGREKGKLETVRVIGSIESWAIRRHLKVQMESPRNNPLKAKRSGVNPKDAAHKSTHWAYAYNHGYDHLIKVGLAKTALAKSMEKK